MGWEVSLQINTWFGSLSSVIYYLCKIMSYVGVCSKKDVLDICLKPYSQKNVVTKVFSVYELCGVIVKVREEKKGKVHGSVCILYMQARIYTYIYIFIKISMLPLDMAAVPKCKCTCPQSSSSSHWPRHSAHTHFTIPRHRAEKLSAGLQPPTQHCGEQEISMGCTLWKLKENLR